METFIAADYNELSQRAAADLVAITNNKKEPLICIASGDSPAGMYKVIVDKVTNQQLDVADWNFLSLDEWVGLNGSDEGSCRYHLNNQLLHSLKIADDKIAFFDGRATDLSQQCIMAEDCIQQHGGIDVAILGLGLNGHIGMNEPGTSITTRTHVGLLDLQTQQVGQKYFQKEQLLTSGITLGLATLIEAKHIFLLVSGSKKAAIVKQMLQDEISENIPATLFRNHPGLKIYLDKEAAQLLPG